MLPINKGEISFDDISPFSFDFLYFNTFINILIRKDLLRIWLRLLLFADEIVLNMILHHIMKNITTIIQRYTIIFYCKTINLMVKSD